MANAKVKLEIFSKIPGLPDTSNITDPQLRLFLDRVKAALEEMKTVSVDADVLAKSLVKSKTFINSVKNSASLTGNGGNSGTDDSGDEPFQDVIEKDPVATGDYEDVPIQNAFLAFQGYNTDSPNQVIAADFFENDFHSPRTVNVYSSYLEGAYPGDVSNDEKSKYSTESVTAAQVSTFDKSGVPGTIAGMKFEHIYTSDGEIYGVPDFDGLVAVLTGNSKQLLETQWFSDDDHPDGGSYKNVNVECIEITNQLRTKTAWIKRSEWERTRSVPVYESITQGGPEKDEGVGYPNDEYYWIEQNDEIGYRARGVKHTSNYVHGNVRLFMYNGYLYELGDSSTPDGHVYKPIYKIVD